MEDCKPAMSQMCITDMHTVVAKVGVLQGGRRVASMSNHQRSPACQAEDPDLELCVRLGWWRC